MNKFITFLLVVSSVAMADVKSVRWTGKQDSNPEIGHILEVVKAKTGIELSITDFALVENRALATSHFTMLAQTKAGVPIRGQSLRIWTSLKGDEAIQVEARLSPREAENLAAQAESFRADMSSDETMQIARRAVREQGDDTVIRNVEWSDNWDHNALVRTVTLKGKHGVHHVSISLVTKKILKNTYSEFPQADRAGEFSVPAKVYPIYEEVENEPGKILPRIDSQLRYLKMQAHRPEKDPYEPLRTVRYQDDKYDPLKGLTAEGRAKGYWAMAYIKAAAKSLLDKTPEVENSFANGAILDGRYATVSLYPDVMAKFKGIGFTPALSGQFMPFFAPMADNPDHFEMIPSATLLGRTLKSADDAYNRVARRLADHDPATYINDGFDEIQVYWSITQMFESLRAMGFTDPDLSTRPFNAFLYDPDIEYRDNAFYTDDTINFTTYSSEQPNMARDNSTIWHELGHGVMDRLMGDHIQLADTGGLSEGMADFIAQLIINDVTSGTPFPGKEALRIFNNMGFNLSNEVHDDGEAYGGAMNDLLRGAMAQYGRPGLVKVTNLTLETMRLTRNHPGLTANDWFDHMLFADELGAGGIRRSGELRDLIVRALNGRNFAFDGSPAATLTVKNGADEVTATSLGSRNNPINLDMTAEEKKAYTLNVSLKGSKTYQFKYPVTVKVDFKQGALQGAIHWVGEETNPLKFTLNADGEVLSIPLTALGKCDSINQPDGSCKDYAYVQVWNDGETNKPQAKKRFYLRIHPK